MRKPCAFDAKDRVCTALLGMAMLLVTTTAWAGEAPDPTTTAGTSHDVSELRQELSTAMARIDELQRKLEQRQVSEEYQQKLEAEMEQVQAMQTRLNQMAAAYLPQAQTQDTTGAAQNLQPSTGTPAPAATPSGPSLASLLGPTTFSGFVDVYYEQNFRNPSPTANPATNLGTIPVNTLRPFDLATNQFGLNMIELVIDRAPDTTNRTGYHVGLGFGEAMNVVNASEPKTGLGFDQYLKEAYFSYLAPVGKGLQVDVGKFVTPAGAEVIETKDNWNYSRGLLFGYAIPFFHFGMRAKYTFNDKYALTGFFVNGWNNVVDNNTGKTGGLSFNWNPNKKFGVAQTLLIGPETSTFTVPNANSNFRQLHDTVVTYNVTPKFSLMANYDYGRGDRTLLSSAPVTLSKVIWWQGIAGYLKYAPSARYSFSTRYEYYDDKYGFTTGNPEHLHEVTGTLERIIAGKIISRVEYRHDISTLPVFFKGVTPVRNQDTMTAGLVYTFNSQEAK